MGARGHPPINNQSPYTPYKGQMDDMRLYTRALNDSEIAFMFERSRDPWTYKMVTLQLANGTFMFVELSPDGVDPQCLGTNGVCVTGSSESDLIAAAGLFTGSLTDRVRCGSELQNVTGETGYDSGSSHWCAQAAVYLKGTTTTFTTTSLTSSTTTFTETSTSETETTSSLTETSTSETLTSSTVTHTSTSETETTSSLTHTSTSGTETSSSHTRTSTSESETTSSLSRTSTSETERSTSESVTSTSETETSSSLSATSTSASESRTTTAAAQPTTTPVVPAGLANYTAIPLLDGTWILATLSDNGDPQCVPSSSAGSTCMSAPDNATLWRSAENITAAQLNNPLVCGSALETTTGTTGYQDGHWCWQAAAVLGSDVVANDNWCSDPLLGTTGLRNRWVYHPARKTFIDCIGGLHPTLVNVVSGGTNVSFTDVAGSIPLRKAMTTDGQGAGFEIDQAMFAIGYADFTFSFWMLPDPTVVDKQLLFSDRLYSTASGENFTFVMVHPAEERVSMELLSGSVSEYQVIEVRNTAGYVPLPNLFNSTWSVELCISP